MEEHENSLDGLPSDYNDHIISSRDEKVFGIKEVKDKDSAEAWLRECSLRTKTTWRVERTYPNAVIMNLFRKDYHCCLNTDRRAKGIRPSKHTGCQAKLEIVVKW
ncbi:hypothetical protein AVEN_13872-1 [Araneus ventricosus]|uniref:Uncharacterized protein n=1 Tax=Araneus ventricosus TaxID=182803 RepID=A0A4Y2M5W4_ARAVE|nr:hypothetical protein AVEN_13872-1 [Araneus ventricosus]